MKQKALWIKVTLDEYELPLCVADTVEELAQMCGVKTNTIYTNMSKAKHGRDIQRTSYRKVQLIDDDKESR